MTTPASPTPLPLWSGPAPLSHGTAPEDIPAIIPFLPPASSSPTPAVVICPGGGYAMLAMQHEGINVAGWFQARGVAAFVLRYRLSTHGYRHPAPLLDVQRAMRVVRSRAREWNLNAAKVGVLGFSAGGHLTATLATHFDAGNPQAADPIDRMGCRPDYAVPIYAVISLKPEVTNAQSTLNLLGPDPDPALIESLSCETQVTPQTPPTLIVASADDTIVKIENSRLFYAALQKAGVVSELQEYAHGRHGFGYGETPDFSPPGWLERAGRWIEDRGFMK
jgi:acetyl esterase/lipase